MRQAAPFRAIRGDRFSVNSTLPRLYMFELVMFVLPIPGSRSRGKMPKSEFMTSKGSPTNLANCPDPLIVEAYYT